MADQVRFVHAADLHLDAPFKGVDATDQRVRDALTSSTYEALECIVQLCLEEAVDFLVLAGDVYNQAEKQLRAEFAFRAACERLSEAGIAVFVARGNHDPASGFSAGLTMPESVHFFSEREVERIPFLRDGREVCALYGRSFRTAAETENLARDFRRAEGDRLAVGVLHANIGGRTEYEPYAPCSLDDLRAARMDYWALGHIHKPETLATEPHVVYAGCPQGLDPTEPGIRGCTLVTLSNDGAEVEFVPTSRIVWSSADVACDSSTEGVDDVRRQVLFALDEARAAAEGRPVVFRMELTGRCAAHAALARPGIMRDLITDVRAEGLDSDAWVWVDRIVDHTRPALDFDAIRCGEDFAGDLLRRAESILGDERQAEEYVASLARAAFDALDARDLPDVDPASVIERARDLALDRLLTEDER